MDGEDGEAFVEGLGQPSNKSCTFRNNEPNLMTFYEDQQITEDVVEFPPGTELVILLYEDSLSLSLSLSLPLYHHPV